MRDSDRPMTQREAYQRGYAAGYAAAQSGPPREPVFCPQRKKPCIAGCPYPSECPEPAPSAERAEAERDAANGLDHQSAAGTNCAAEDGARPSPESARGPAADPIADLCERLRALHIIDEVGSDNPLGRDAADALERLARVSDSWRKLAQENGDDKRALMDERDTLRAVVRAADAMRAVAATRPDGLYGGHQVAAYDRARAKVKVTL